MTDRKQFFLFLKSKGACISTTKNNLECYNCIADLCCPAEPDIKLKNIIDYGYRRGYITKEKASSLLFEELL